MGWDDLEPCSDAELLAIVQSGNDDAAERAFEAMYFRHRAFVFRVARRFAGDDEAAMDAAQEVFMHLLKKLPRLRLCGKLTTYLYPIAKNAGIDRKRKARGERRRIEQRGAVERARGDERIGGPVGGAAEPALAAALEALPDGQREVLLMRVVDGMSVDEVAAALGVPEGTVKSRLFHALAGLRERLGDVG